MNAEELVKQGAELAAAGNLEEAVRSYREAHELRSGEGSILLGISLGQLGRSEEAIVALSGADRSAVIPGRFDVRRGNSGEIK